MTRYILLINLILFTLVVRTFTVRALIRDVLYTFVQHLHSHPHFASDREEYRGFCVLTKVDLLYLITNTYELHSSFGFLVITFVKFFFTLTSVKSPKCCLLCVLNTLNPHNQTNINFELFCHTYSTLHTHYHQTKVLPSTGTQKNYCMVPTS